MFGEEGKTNFTQFAGKARLVYILNSLLGLLIFSVVIFPLTVLLPLTIPFIAWYANQWLGRFKFTLDESKLFVRYGVFLYNYQLIPYENVQDIHVTQSLVDQIFGMWSVTVFTATVGGGSARIPLLEKDGAERLKDELFRKMKEARNVTD